jgi:hypothetical protein
MSALLPKADIAEHWMAKKTTRRKCIAAIGAAMLPRPLIAQQAPSPVIGVLDSAAATALKLSTFYEGLKVEGFSRNQNLSVEYHSRKAIMPVYLSLQPICSVTALR